MLPSGQLLPDRAIENKGSSYAPRPTYGSNRGQVVGIVTFFFFFLVVVVVVVAVGMIVTRFLSDSNATRRPCANLSGSVFHDQRSARSNGVRRPKQTARPTLLGLKRIGGHSGSLKMWLCPQNKAKLALSNLCCFNEPSHYQRAPSGHTK